MKTQVIKANQSHHLLMWITGIAVILLCVVGIAAIMGWIPTSMSHPGDNTDLAKPDSQSTDTVKPPARNIHEARVANNVPAQAQCAECGVIESVREVNTKGEGSGLGVVGGAVVGGLLGNQVGGGRGNDIATVAGAVGGAVAGNQIEKSVRSTKSHDITVRFEDGSSRVIHDTNPSAWRLGDRVKVINGVIRSND